MIQFLACSQPELPRCNGAIALCERTVDEVAFLRAHNAHASEERGYHLASRNHTFAIPTQLEDGVRSLNIDVYEWEDELATCHGFCELGTQPFDEVLNEISTFLDENPSETILVDFQDEATDGAIEAAISGHALGDRVYEQVAGEPWPTLGELGGRLVPLDGGHVYGTGWDYDTPEELDCTVQGEVLDGGLYEVTHVLTNPIASPDNAEWINHQPVIGDHVRDCVDEVGFINLLSVDYYSVGDGLEVIDALNIDGPR